MNLPGGAASALGRRGVQSGARSHASFFRGPVCEAARDLCLAKVHATRVKYDATLVMDDDTPVMDDATLVMDDDILVMDDATLVMDDQTLVMDDETRVKHDAERGATPEGPVTSSFADLIGRLLRLSYAVASIATNYL